MENKNSKNIQWLSISIIVASILISGSILYSKYFSSDKSNNIVNNQQPSVQQSTGNTQQVAGTVKVSTDDDAYLDKENAPVTLIEFSDFQCPFCRSFFFGTLPQIKKEYIDTGKLKFVYRDFPLSFHPGSKPAALAAECSKEQGRFWELHDKIFSEQQKQGQGTVQFTVEDLKKWALQIGLDTSQFNQCLDSEKYKNEVEKDMADGQSAGVSGTPTFFIGKSNNNGIIDGTAIRGARPFEAFKTAIDEELKKAGS